MNEHSAYFLRQFEASKLLLYGPVMAPDGAFGLGILEVGDEAEARQFGENDPSVRAGLNRWELYPMRVSGSRAKGQIIRGNGQGLQRVAGAAWCAASARAAHLGREVSVRASGSGPRLAWMHQCATT